MCSVKCSVKCTFKFFPWPGHTLNIWKASLLYESLHVSSCCLMRIPPSFNTCVFLHFEHLNGFSPLWVLSFFYNWSDFQKFLSHFEHLKCSSLWVPSCFFKLPTCENVFLHFEHLNGFSSVWVSHWFDFQKFLSHLEHLKGFSPLSNNSYGLNKSYRGKIAQKY